MVKEVEGTVEEPVFLDGLTAQPGEEYDGGHGEDIHIREESLVADVELVETELIGQDGAEVVIHKAGALEQVFLIAVGDGGGAGDAGADGEDLVTEICGPGFGEGGVFWAGSDEAHIAFEDVPELGELVELGIAQPFAEGGDAGIAIGGDGRTAVTGFGLVHGAEFENVEGLVMAPGAETFEEDGAFGVALDGDGDYGEEGGEDDQCDEGDDDITEALESAFEVERLIGIHASCAWMGLGRFLVGNTAHRLPLFIIKRIMTLAVVWGIIT